MDQIEMMESSCVIKTVDDPQQQKSGFMDIRALTETNEVRSNLARSKHGQQRISSIFPQYRLNIQQKRKINNSIVRVYVRISLQEILRIWTLSTPGITVGSIKRLLTRCSKTDKENIEGGMSPEYIIDS